MIASVFFFSKYIFNLFDVYEIIALMVAIESIHSLSTEIDDHTVKSIKTYSCNVQNSSRLWWIFKFFKYIFIDFAVPNFMIIRFSVKEIINAKI